MAQHSAGSEIFCSEKQQATAAVGTSSYYSCWSSDVGTLDILGGYCYCHQVLSIKTLTFTMATVAAHEPWVSTLSPQGLAVLRNSSRDWGKQFQPLPSAVLALSLSPLPLLLTASVPICSLKLFSHTSCCYCHCCCSAATVPTSTATSAATHFHATSSSHSYDKNHK